METFIAWVIGVKQPCVCVCVKWMREGENEAQIVHGNPGPVVHKCNSRICKVKEAGASRIQGHSQLQSKFQASKGYKGPCLTKELKNSVFITDKGKDEIP